MAKQSANGNPVRPTLRPWTYAYGQVPLGNDTSKHCNFSLVVGLIQDGVVRLNYDAGGISTEMDSILNECSNAHAFIIDTISKDGTFCHCRESFEKIGSRKYGAQTTEKRLCKNRMRVVRA